MPEHESPGTKIARVSLSPELLRQVLGGAEYSCDVFEARLELLLVSQKELVRTRQASAGTADLRNQLAVVSQARAKEKAATETLLRERDEARLKVLMLNDELAMAKFWRRVNNRELSGYLAVITRLRGEVEFLTVHDRVRDVLLILVFTALGFFCGYVYRPLIERHTHPNDAEETQPETPSPRPTPPAPPRGREGHR